MQTIEPLGDGVHGHFDYRPEPNRLSPNGAKKLLPPSTPAKFDYDRKHPQEPRRVWDFGKVAHKLVLGEGDQLLILDPEIHGLKKDGTVADSPRATGMWQLAESNARAEGLTPIHIEDYRKAVEMAQVVNAHETAGPLLADGDAEQWLYSTDAETGQPLRQRLDWMTRGRDGRGRLTIVEYKTAVDASPEVFGRVVFKQGYHVACAFAVTGAKALGMDATYIIVAQEKHPPYQVSIHELDLEAFRYSCRQMREAITTFQRCTEAGKWPSYPVGINSIALPLWAVDEEMEFAE